MTMQKNQGFLLTSYGKAVAAEFSSCVNDAVMDAQACLAGAPYACLQQHGMPRGCRQRR